MRHSIWISLILATISNLAAAQTPVLTVEEDLDGIALDGYLSLYQDLDSKLALESIEALPEQQWVSGLEEGMAFGFVNHAVWARLIVTNPGDEELELLVQNRQILLDHISVYQRIGTDVIEYHYGENHRFSDRQLASRYPVFTLTIPPGEHALYFRSRTGDFNKISLVAWDSESYIDFTRFDLILIGICLGVLLVMVGYNLILYLGLRIPAFGLYVVHLIAFLFCQLAVLGIGQAYLWPQDSNGFSNVVLSLGADAIAIAATLFTISFLELKKRTPRMARFLYSCCAWYGATIMLYLVAGNVSTPFSAFNDAFVLVSLLAVGIYNSTKGYRPAQFFTIAWTFLCAGNFLTNMALIDLFPVNDFTTYSGIVGTAIEATLLSMALANKLRGEQEKARQTIVGLNRKLSRESMEIQVLNQTLEARVETRTKQLEKAVAENKSLVRLLCHDIRNPLTAIRGYVDLLQDEPDSLDEYIKEIRQVSEMMDRMVVQVTQLEGVNSGKLQLELESVDIDTILVQARMIFNSRLSKKGVGLIYDAAASPVFVLAEEVGLCNQVINNLISNAIKFTPRGGRITIVVREEADCILVTVRDSGVGISENRLPRLFDLNHKTSTPGTDGEAGTGFGLPIVKMFMEKFGGGIEVISRCADQFPEDHGTSFVLRFQPGVCRLAQDVAGTA